MHFLFHLAALEGYNTVIVSSRPSFSVAVDKGDESSLANRIAATFQEAIVFVFAVDDAGSAIIFDKRNGKELSLGLVDEGIQFGADCGWGHGLHVVFVVEIEVIGFPATGVASGNTDFIPDDDYKTGDDCERSEDEEGVNEGVDVELHDVVFWLRVRD